MNSHWLFKDLPSKIIGRVLDKASKFVCRFFQVTPEEAIRAFNEYMKQEPAILYLALKRLNVDESTGIVIHEMVEALLLKSEFGRVIQPHEVPEEKRIRFELFIHPMANAAELKFYEEKDRQDLINRLKSKTGYALQEAFVKRSKEALEEAEKRRKRLVK